MALSFSCSQHLFTSTHLPSAYTLDEFIEPTDDLIILGACLIFGGDLPLAVGMFIFFDRFMEVEI